MAKLYPNWGGPHCKYSLFWGWYFDGNILELHQCRERMQGNYALAPTFLFLLMPFLKDATDIWVWLRERLRFGLLH